MATGFSVMDALNKNSKAGVDESPRARFRTKDISIFKMYRIPGTVRTLICTSIHKRPSDTSKADYHHTEHHLNMLDQFPVFRIIEITKKHNQHKKKYHKLVHDYNSPVTGKAYCNSQKHNKRHIKPAYRLNHNI